MLVCIDTNVVLGMFGRAAPLLGLRQALLVGKFRWALSTEILLEYEGIAVREMGDEGVERVLRFIELADQARGAILHISPSYRFHLITHDPDDNKFADCAIAADADFIITEDRHFQPLSGSGYKPQPVTAAEFMATYL